MKAISAAAAGILVPQDYQMPGDNKGKRKKIRPEDLRSGTLFGQYQLRGSILTIKDASTTASGYMAFGTDMTTIPTSNASGTGVYIDYTGIYGLNSGTKQFYLQASDGKAYAGAGSVVLDVSGLTLDADNAAHLSWESGGVDFVKAFAYPNASYGVGTTNTSRWWLYNHGNASYPDAISSIESYSTSGYGAAVSVYADESANAVWAQVSRTGGSGSVSLSIGQVMPETPLARLHIKDTVPTFLMEDSTGSANDAYFKLDGNKLYIQEYTDTDGDMVTLDLANARIGIGMASPESALHVVTQTSSQPRGITIDNYVGTTSAGSIMLRKSRGTPGSPSALLSGDGLGAVCFQGWNGSAFGSLTTHAATIQSLATQNWSAGVNGCSMIFSITPNGTENHTGAMILDQSGFLGIGGITAPSEMLHVKGSGNIKAKVESTLNTGYAFMRLQNDTSAMDFGHYGSTASGTLFGTNKAGLGTMYNSDVLAIGTVSAHSLILGTNNAAHLTINSAGSAILNNAAVATTATDGFLYVAACAGAPTGVPTAVTGRIPIVVDSTNSKMYIYSGGAWQALN